jgi:hypothetical protein
MHKVATEIYISLLGFALHSLRLFLLIVLDLVSPSLSEKIITLLSSNGNMKDDSTVW